MSIAIVVQLLSLLGPEVFLIVQNLMVRTYMYCNAYKNDSQTSCHVNACAGDILALNV